MQFVDKQEGWVVGDQGVIWHSTDGGTRWERQKSGTRASLRAIHFLTPFTGWVAGRVEQPYGMVATGVVLKTTDGGLTWQEVAAGILPGLNVIKFFDDKNGIVAGDGCPAFPSGVFKTTDGGENWAVIPGRKATSTSWITGDITDLENAVFIGRSNTIGELANGKLSIEKFRRDWVFPSSDLVKEEIKQCRVLTRRNRELLGLCRPNWHSFYEIMESEVLQQISQF